MQKYMYRFGQRQRLYVLKEDYMGLLKKFRKYIGGKRLEWPLPFREGLTFQDITVRDPFIVKDGSGGYIMAGTIYHYNFNDSYGTVIYKSEDLKLWRGPFTILKKSALEKKYADFWAPEIHFAQGKYRLLITLSPEGEKRGTYMFSCDKPDGDYKNGVRLTPEKFSCPDGTLAEDNGRYWCIYCKEYIECNDGEIRAVRLKEDLSGTEEETDVLLFRASDNIYKPAKTRQKVTDGPFCYFENGERKLLWSTRTSDRKYVQLTARSVDGRVNGEWVQEGAIYTSDGGHGMIFTTYEGERYLILHSPDARTAFTKKYERPVLIPYPETDKIKR